MSSKSKSETEFIIILANENAAENQIRLGRLLYQHEGRISNRYPPRIIVASGDSKLIKKIAAIAGVAKVSETMIQNPEKYGLDEHSLLVVEGWNIRKSDQFKKTKRTISKEIKSWNSTLKTV